MKLTLFVIAAIPVGAFIGLIVAAKIYDFDEDYRRVRRQRARWITK